MKISKKRIDLLYLAIHAEIIDIRIKLNLPAESDIKLAKVEHKIYDSIKRILDISEK